MEDEVGEGRVAHHVHSLLRRRRAVAHLRHHQEGLGHSSHQRRDAPAGAGDPGDEVKIQVAPVMVDPWPKKNERREPSPPPLLIHFTGLMRGRKYSMFRIPTLHILYGSVRAARPPTH